MGNEKKLVAGRLLDAFLAAMLCGWSLIFVFLFASAVQQPNFFSTNFSDFTKFYAMGKLLASGQGTQLYSMETQRFWVDQVTAPGRVPDLNFSEQPPHFLAQFALVSGLAPAAALMASLLFFGIAGAIALWWLSHSARTLGGWKVLLVVLIALGSGPSIANFLQGQVAWLMVAIFAAYFSSMIIGSNVGLGVSLAICTVKPQYLPFLLIPAIAQRKWKSLGIAIFSGLVLLVGCILLVGPDAVINYVPMILSSDTGGEWVARPYRTMTCIRGVLTQFLGIKIALYLAALLMVLALVTIYFLWRAPKDKIYASAQTVFLTLLFSVHTYLYDNLLLLIPLVILHRDLGIFGEPGSARISKLFFCLFSIATAVIFFSIRDDIRALLFFLLLCAGAMIVWWYKLRGRQSGEGTDI